MMIIVLGILIAVSLAYYFRQKQRLSQEDRQEALRRKQEDLLQRLRRQKERGHRERAEEDDQPDG